MFVSAGGLHRRTLEIMTVLLNNVEIEPVASPAFDLRGRHNSRPGGGGGDETKKFPDMLLKFKTQCYVACYLIFLLCKKN